MSQLYPLKLTFVVIHEQSNFDLVDFIAGCITVKLCWRVEEIFGCLLEVIVFTLNVIHCIKRRIAEVQYMSGSYWCQSNAPFMDS